MLEGALSESKLLGDEERAKLLGLRSLKDARFNLNNSQLLDNLFQQVGSSAHMSNSGKTEKTLNLRPMGRREGEKTVIVVGFFLSFFLFFSIPLVY